MKRVGRILLHEFKLVLPPTTFFIIGFNLVILTQRLILADYLVQVAGFLVATTTALVVGKAVLVADKLPFLNRFENAPLIRPILFKTFVYWAVVFIARLLEAFIHHLFEAGSASGFWTALEGRFSWGRFLFVQIWILVLFLIYVTGSEFNTLFGDGELYRLLFKRRSTEVKQTRRQRIRTLARLSRLASRHTVAEFQDTDGPLYRETIGLITDLAKDAPAPSPGAEQVRVHIAAPASAPLPSRQSEQQPVAP